MPLLSIGTPARRWLTIVTSATTSAPSSGSTSSPNSVPKHTFEPCSGNRIGASGREPGRCRRDDRAARRSRRSPARRRRLACACVSATTAATMSPTKRTRSLGEDRPVERRAASSGSPGTTAAEVVAAAWYTAITPGIDSASPTSTEVMVPWATGERTNATCSIPVSTRSSTYLPAPVSSVGSSSRCTALPKIEPAAAM